MAQALVLALTHHRWAVGWRVDVCALGQGGPPPALRQVPGPLSASWMSAYAALLLTCRVCDIYTVCPVLRL